jgi:hypothetical protein
MADQVPQACILKRDDRSTRGARVPPQGMDGSADAVQLAHQSRSGEALSEARQVAREPRVWQRSGKQATDSEGGMDRLRTELNRDSHLPASERQSCVGWPRNASIGGFYGAPSSFARTSF